MGNLEESQTHQIIGWRVLGVRYLAKGCSAAKTQPEKVYKDVVFPSEEIRKNSELKSKNPYSPSSYISLIILSDTLFLLLFFSC